MNRNRRLALIFAVASISVVAFPVTALLSQAATAQREEPEGRELAAKAEGVATWRRLLGPLVGSGGPEAAVRGVLAHGATSGADTLAGFLALNPAP